MQLDQGGRFGGRGVGWGVSNPEDRSIADGALFGAYIPYGPWQGQCISRVLQPYPTVSRSLDIKAVLEARNFCPYRGGGVGRARQTIDRAPCRPSQCRRMFNA